MKPKISLSLADLEMIVARAKFNQTIDTSLSGIVTVELHDRSDVCGRPDSYIVMQDSGHAECYGKLIGTFNF